MRPLIAGNWKMHGMAPQLAEIEAIAASAKALPPSADLLICVPATLIARAAQTAVGQIAIGGEDCSAEASGAYTGDISAEMLRGAGATAVIVGAHHQNLHRIASPGALIRVSIFRASSRRPAIAKVQSSDASIGLPARCGLP